MVTSMETITYTASKHVHACTHSPLSLATEKIDTLLQHGPFINIDTLLQHGPFINIDTLLQHGPFINIAVAGVIQMDERLHTACISVMHYI
jgi:hypothetical protein